MQAKETKTLSKLDARLSHLEYQLKLCVEHAEKLLIVLDPILDEPASEAESGDKKGVPDATKPIYAIERLQMQANKVDNMLLNLINRQHVTTISDSDGGKLAAREVASKR